MSGERGWVGTKRGKDKHTVRATLAAVCVCVCHEGVQRQQVHWAQIRPLYLQRNSTRLSGQNSRSGGFGE